jgi:hypothetical protein
MSAISTSDFFGNFPGSFTKLEIIPAKAVTNLPAFNASKTKVINTLSFNPTNFPDGIYNIKPITNRCGISYGKNSNIKGRVFNMQIDFFIVESDEKLIEFFNNYGHVKFVAIVRNEDKAYLVGSSIFPLILEFDFTRPVTIGSTTGYSCKLSGSTPYALPLYDPQI